MAELRETFVEGLEITFSMFEEAVHNGTYFLGSSNEFEEDYEPPQSSIRCIFLSHKEKDVALLSFSDLIQPNDIVGIIPYDDMDQEMSNEGYIEFTDVTGIYTVVGHEKDPMNVTYTALLRKN